MSGPPARDCSSRGNRSRPLRRQSPRLPAILGLLRRWRAGSHLARDLKCPSRSRRFSHLTSAFHLAGADRSDAINVDPDPDPFHVAWSPTQESDHGAASP
jgi:hypothetical protein